MTSSLYVNVAWILFLLVATIHFTRILLGLSVTIDGWQLPLWVNAAGFLITAYMAYQGFRLSQQSK